MRVPFATLGSNLLLMEADSLHMTGAQGLAGIRNLSTVDAAAVRLWLDKRVQTKTPSNVMAGFDEGVGATFFELHTLQVRQALHWTDMPAYSKLQAGMCLCHLQLNCIVARV